MTQTERALDRQRLATRNTMQLNIAVRVAATTQQDLLTVIEIVSEVFAHLFPKEEA